MKASKKDIQILTVLTARADFLRVHESGQKWISKTVIFQYLDNKDQGLRFGLVASKKLSKSAVVRNRIRRRLRAAARDVLPDAARTNRDYVLIGRPATATCAYEDLKNDLLWCLKKTESLS